MKFGLVDDIYEKIRQIAIKNNNYKFKIFGSRTKNTYKVTSDIDIAIFENVPEEDEYAIRNSLLHLYDEENSRQIYDAIKNEYFVEIEKLVEFFEKSK